MYLFIICFNLLEIKYYMNKLFINKLIDIIELRYFL